MRMRSRSSWLTGKRSAICVLSHSASGSRYDTLAELYAPGYAGEHVSQRPPPAGGGRRAYGWRGVLQWPHIRRECGRGAGLLPREEQQPEIERLVEQFHELFRQIDREKER